jgi:hypothetical protein
VDGALRRCRGGARRLGGLTGCCLRPTLAGARLGGAGVSAAPPWPAADRRAKGGTGFWWGNVASMVTTVWRKFGGAGSASGCECARKTCVGTPTARQWPCRPRSRARQERHGLGEAPVVGFSKQALHGWVQEAKLYTLSNRIYPRGGTAQWSLFEQTPSAKTSKVNWE